jgi:glycosyltransferase involved in cell wall biosynthesis
VRADLAHFQYVIPPGWRGRSVITVHDLSFEFHPEFFSLRDRVLLRRLVPVAARRAEKVFTVSKFTAAALIERYRLPEDKVVVTPNGLDPIFGPDGPRRGGRPYLLFVGALQPRKDPITAVRALARLDSGLDLLMVGPQKRAVADVVAAVDELHLTARVHFLGHVATDELACLYRGAECLVMPSRYEGFGLPVLEAMASGTPVVAAATGALPEVLGDAGVLVPAGDHEALAAGVCTAMLGRKGLVAAGLSRAGHFQWSATAARTVATYEPLV